MEVFYMSRFLQSLLVVSLALILAAVLFHSVSFAYDDGDQQFWHTYGLSWAVTDKLKLKAEGEYKIGDNVTEDYYRHFDFGADYKLLSWFTLGLNYRYAYELKGGSWVEEKRAHMNGTISWKLGGYSLSDRSRLEYRMVAGSDDKWRYRNKLTVKLPVKWTDFAIQPYFADEMFLDMAGNGFNKNRFYAGLGASLIDHLGGELYYLIESGKSGDVWKNTNVIGMKLKLSF
jgi:hypothetical protein